MSNNYATQLPHDRGGNVMQEFNVQVPAIEETLAVTGVSSLMSLNDNTTTLEVAAVANAVAIKWITIASTNPSVFTGSNANADFDHVIPAGTVRRFVVPRETQGISGPVPANSVNGLYQRMAMGPINGGVASILVTEY